MYHNNLPNYTFEVGYGNLTNDKNQGYFVTYNKPNEPYSGVHHAGLMRHGRKNDDDEKIFKLVDTQSDLHNYALDLNGMAFQPLEVGSLILPKTGDANITTTITAGSNLTENRFYDFPNTSGTFAVAPLGVDPDLSKYVTLATNQTITGSKTIENDLTITGDLTVSGIINFATDEYLVPNGKTITQNDIVEYTDQGLQKRANFPRQVIQRGILHCNMATIGNDYAMIAYANNSKQGCLQLISINSNTNAITKVGAEITFTDPDTDIRYININVLSFIADTSAELLLVYQDSSQGGLAFARLVTCVISPTSITLQGSPYQFTFGDTRDIACSVLSSSVAVVSYRDEKSIAHAGTSQILNIVLSPTYLINGNLPPSYTFVFNNKETRYISSDTIDSTHVLLSYEDYSQIVQGTCIILDITAPATIVAGAPVVFSSEKVSYTSVLKMDSTHGMVCYTNTSSSNYGNVCGFSWSGTTITLGGTPIIFNIGDTGYIKLVRNTVGDGSSATVIYNDSSNNNYGMAQVITLSGTTPTVHSETAYYSTPNSFLAIVRVNTNSTDYRLCVVDSSGEAQCLYIPSSGSASTYIFPNSFFLVGISRETITGTGLGTYCKVATGGVVTSLSGLIKGSPYWLAMNGDVLTDTAHNTYDIYMGYAIATTKFHLRIATKW